MEGKKKTWLIVGAIALVAVLVGVAGAAYWMTAGKKDTDAKKVAVSETKDKKTEAKESDSYEGWKTYENSALGYTLKYPADWTFTKSPATVNGAAADYVVFNNDDFDYAFTFGLRKVGSALVITDRTAPPEGTSAPGGNVKIFSQTVEKTYCVDTTGRVSNIFYGTALAGTFTIIDNEISAELAVPGYKDKSLQGDPKELLADLIITSLTIK
jgi:hypothetical protein